MYPILCANTYYDVITFKVDAMVSNNKKNITRMQHEKRNPKLRYIELPTCGGYSSRDEEQHKIKWSARLRYLLKYE